MKVLFLQTFHGFAVLCIASSLLLAASVGHAIPAYRDSIPNGNNVYRHGSLWPAVGHATTDGGRSTVNTFATHFKAAGYAWTATLCQQDSDGDGFTNGQELGDPNCVWTTGRTPSRTTGITHPGFADSFPVNPPAPTGVVVAGVGAGWVLEGGNLTFTLSATAGRWTAVAFSAAGMAGKGVACALEPTASCTRLVIVNYGITEDGPVDVIASTSTNITFRLPIAQLTSAATTGTLRVNFATGVYNSTAGASPRFIPHTAKGSTTINPSISSAAVTTRPTVSGAADATRLLTIGSAACWTLAATVLTVVVTTMGA